MLASVDISIPHTSQDWGAILPEVSLAVLVLVVLTGAILFPRQNRLNAVLAIGGLLALTVGFTCWFVCSGIPFENSPSFGGLLYHHSFGQWMRLFFAITGLVVLFYGSVFLGRRQLPQTEFFVLVLTITGGLMLLVQSHNMLMLFVALETVTIGFYILVSFYRYKSFSLEAGIKYLILGALSSGILLAGIVLLYGAASNPELAGHVEDALDFEQLRLFLTLQGDLLIVQAGVVLILCGIAFKIGAVPFQIWIPDVYQGAPSPVTLFLSVGSKAGGFAVLLVLISVPLEPVRDLVLPVITVFAILSMLFGNLAAISQTNVKRMLGLSGVSHAGYLLMGVVAFMYLGDVVLPVILFYLFVYAFASFAVFGVLVYRNHPDDAHIEIADFVGMGKNHPLLGAVLLLGVVSLAGIPPMAGFVGKLMIFYYAFQAGAYVLLGAAILGVVLSIYYYFGWIRAAWFVREGETHESQKEAIEAFSSPSAGSSVVLILFAAISLILGFLPLGLLNWW